MNWLDTQTKEILQKAIEPKLAPPKVAEFALVLVTKGSDHGRLVRAICRVNECDESHAVELAERRTPVRVNSDLSEEDALWGQFELICCDAVSIFVRSEVLDQMDLAEFQSLIHKTSQSTEFQPTTVNIAAIPRTESGLKFVDQFLGGIKPEKLSALPSTIMVPFKNGKNHAALGDTSGCETSMSNQVEFSDSWPGKSPLPKAKARPGVVTVSLVKYAKSKK